MKPNMQVDWMIEKKNPENVKKIQRTQAGTWASG